VMNVTCRIYKGCVCICRFSFGQRFSAGGRYQGYVYLPSIGL
jgi:hypothetical protein